MKISVITVCLNNEYLEKTIESVINQTYVNLELIIIDGGSTNKKSINALSKYSAIKNISIVSEEDKGIYDGMNKGILKAKGDYIIFVNAGDQLVSNNIIDVASKQFDDNDIIYGNLEVNEENQKWVKKYPDKLSFSYFLNDTLPHPSSFIKRSLFERFGYYDCSMKISADWAFFISSVCRYNISYKYISNVISKFSYDGISSKRENQELINKEKKDFLQKNFSMYITDYQEMDEIKAKQIALKNSRLVKYLSIIFKQLRF